MSSPTSNPLDLPDSDPFEVARDAAARIAELSGVPRHDIALTLGSGWRKAADLIGETVATIPASEVVGFSEPAVPGHVGSLRSIRLPNGKHALVIGARTHYYEGHGVRRVVHSVRTAAATGAKVMVLTNGAGGIKEHWKPGTPVLISDHINLTFDSPLEGATFIDLTDLYSSRLRELARTVDPSLDDGVYVQFRGPQYETPAEVQMAKAIGGHIVGMSTALEAIAARQAGMEIIGFSLITNLAAGIQKTPLSHAEVIEAGKNAEAAIGDLLARVVATL
ncbi:purine-nucleoside phosphorylase [Herbiconiux sp. KACC 21604]|uniref:purine-nucleoside phosphorylase n=1 Tax=unclassified Herbiconiux TaxID=2618217 RepID=UPI0014923D85|nr:purine-nucleoside phosphorylase [Herbiconiux sp. SALV-R1]QJU54470.1 purine-nucleoside phosphorylase [Herbiconiux sp. SALV-R1]WPO85548.1 purine-nucleoside phosphorylase [Herbiconiux sp. KACC 21604]